jgi:hypothetical protein
VNSNTLENAFTNILMYNTLVNTDVVKNDEHSRHVRKYLAFCSVSFTLCGLTKKKKSFTLCGPTVFNSAYNFGFFFFFF